MRVFYTDGSASPNPGPGGYAVIEDGKPVALGSETGESTNIRMEGQAIIAAMKLAEGEPCEIHTDSEFWINVITTAQFAYVNQGFNGRADLNESTKRCCERFVY